MRVLPTSTVAETISIMRQAGQTRGWIVTSPVCKTNSKIITSHPIWEPLADVLRNPATFDYRLHEAVFISLGPRSNTLQTATLASTKRGAGAGGVRLWQYNDMWGVMRDGVRLSTGMCRKNALAALWHGGGKGVIASPYAPSDPKLHDKEWREKTFLDYGAFVTSLRGCYNTAEDVVR